MLGDGKPRLAGLLGLTCRQRAELKGLLDVSAFFVVSEQPKLKGKIDGKQAASVERFNIKYGN